MNTSLYQILETRIEAIPGTLTVPQEITTGYRRALWMQGRDAAAKQWRSHVRHNITKEFKPMQKPPVNVTQVAGEINADFWLAGYNAGCEKARCIVVYAMMQLTNGQSIIAR